MHCTVEVLLVGVETLDEVLAASPRLKQYLDSLPEVRLITRRWSGRLAEMPEVRSRLVHCSDNIIGAMTELVHKCSQRGHILFYKDKVITYGGRFSFGDLKLSVRNLLESLERLQASHVKQENKISQTPSRE